MCVYLYIYIYIYIGLTRTPNPIYTYVCMYIYIPRPPAAGVESPGLRRLEAGTLLVFVFLFTYLAKICIYL